MNKVVLLSLFLGLANLLVASPIDKIWNLIEEQKYVSAREELNSILSNEEYSREAAMILSFLNVMELKPINPELKRIITNTSGDVSPYLYALAYEDFMGCTYVKSNSEIINYLEKIISENKVNASELDSKKYILGVKHMLLNDFHAAKEIWKKIESIRAWQLVGPFNNTSGSGHDMEYGPLSSPTNDATFSSKTRAEISWFDLREMDEDPWMTVADFLPNAEATFYAQSFVFSEDESEVLISAGGSGTLKCWLNDHLVLNESDDIFSDLDYLKAEVKLYKGWNRVLVKLSYRDIDNPYFSVRFLNQNKEPIALSKISSEYREYNKSDQIIKPKEIQHFAESYFEKRIESDSSNLLNRFLLAKCYKRAGKNQKALAIVKSLVEVSPNNILFLYELFEYYSELDNHTEMFAVLELIRGLKKHFVLAPVFDYSLELSKNNFQDAKKHLDEILNLVTNDNEEILDLLIQFYAQTNEVEKLYDAIEEAYIKYPENPKFVQYKYNLERSLGGRNESGMNILKKYLKNNYNYYLYNIYAEATKTIDPKKAEKIMLQRIENRPSTLVLRKNLIEDYFKRQNYEDALLQIDRGLLIYPYDAILHNYRGSILENTDRIEEAILSYSNSLKHDPNNFELRERIRKLSEKPSLKSMFFDNEIYDYLSEVAEEKTDVDDNYEIVIQEDAYILFEQAVNSRYGIFAVKINNQSGLDYWKETSLGYSPSFQKLVIEEAYTIKRNKEKIHAETNDNEIVFPSIEIGDVILLVYRIDSQKTGELQDLFATTYTFNDYYPVRKTKLKVLVPESRKIYMEATNLEVEPEVSTIESWIQYKWEMDSLEAIEYESLMPNLNEIGKSVTISTISDWKRITEWYSNLAYPMIKSDYNIDETFESIFPNGSVSNSKIENAKRIYEYICENFNYSSVDFRQSAYVPQKPSITVSTKLGDCKDLSSLYCSLAERAGIKSSLVLVKTRDLGDESIQLPSIDFNHCIVYLELEEQDVFVELTDKNLPFGALDYTLRGANALVIPQTLEKLEANLIRLSNEKYSTEKKRTTSVKIVDQDLHIKTNLVCSGAAVASYRNYLEGLNLEETDEKIASLINSYFDESAIVNNYSLNNFDNKVDTLSISIDFVLQNAVKEIGDIKVFKPIVFEKVGISDDFTDEKRDYPFSYWAYEDTERYAWRTEYNFPQESEVIEYPDKVDIESQSFNYGNVSIKLDDINLLNTSELIPNLTTVKPAVYKQMKKDVQLINDRNNEFIAFKIK